jgi:hypothetical protein
VALRREMFAQTHAFEQFDGIGVCEPMSPLGPAAPPQAWLLMRGNASGTYGLFGSPGRIRTSDQPVNSRLLYR